MDKKTKQLLLIAGGLALLYYFKNRQTQSKYIGDGTVDSQSEYADGGGVGGGGYGGVATGAGSGGSGYVASGDDDTDSLANDPSVTYTGTVSKPPKRPTRPTSPRPMTRVPLVGDITSGASGKPVVGAPSAFNKLPMGGKKLTPPAGPTSYFAY